MEIYKKLSEARELIRNTKIKKAGKNSFSNYEYFTPEQVTQLCEDACQKVGLITFFELKRDELGVYGELIICDIENVKIMKLQQATAIPEIKATNVAQQIGGAVTYTHRYLLMSTFGIVDNSLEFNTTENTKKTVKKDLPILDQNHPNWFKAIESITNGTVTIEQIKNKYFITKKVEELLCNSK